MKKLSFPLLAILALVAPLRAQEPSVYLEPSRAITAIADAAPTPGVSIGPRGRSLLLLERPGLPPIADLAQPELRLAGMRINPRVNGPSRRSYSVGLRLQEIASGDVVAVAGLPETPRLGSFRWSPDARFVAFTHTTDSAIELWLLEVENASAKRLTATAMNAVAGAPCSWMSNSRGLLCLAIDSGRGQVPIRASVPGGPVIQESTGERAAARTFQDLLTDSHDQDLFEYYLASEVRLVGVESRERTIGLPALYVDAELSPDGRLLLLQSLHRPFSYLVPYYRFPRRVRVVDLEGLLVAELADLPLFDAVPIGRGAVATGPRSYAWRADQAATLSWVEARDGGDPRREAEVRDEVFTQAAPFEGEARSLASLGYRYSGVLWGDEGRALVFESWWRTRRIRTWLVDPAEGESRLLVDRSTEDRYSDPGFPVLEHNAAGRSVLAFSDDDGSIFLSGAGASPEGDRPFLDRFDLRTLEAERLWRSEAPFYESFLDFVGGDERALLTRRESPTEVPNLYVRASASGLRALTSFEHPYPQLADVYKEVVRYRRDDGTDLQATLYLPPGKSPEDGPFPMLMWAYPREFKDARAAGQMRGSPFRFKSVSVRGPLPLLAAGFAIFDGPTMPIVGEGDSEPNDRYVEQLISSARAAIDEVVRRGVARRDAIALGGHSYGAFMTANLLAHSDLFRTGIARSGAYNRTLTPFGFQAEERTFWEAPEVYFAMSPFMHADKVNEPVLMLHGVADNNSGTFPLQSERFYNALKGHGARARLVMLPHESHGYASRESVLHTLYEMEAWLQRWLVDDAAGSTSGR
jgi:dipeptidyl aminopeptidase/acylaminoacyl peptidase